MKSAFVRLALSLLSLTIPLCAQTVINVNLTGGNVTLYPPFTIDGVSTTSFLLAPGYTITNVSGDDPGNTGIGSQCNNTAGGCTLSQIGSYIVTAFGIIGFPPNGSMVVNGQLIGMWGFPGFIATTFNSSVDANGVLAVYGNAAGYSSFNECDLQNQCGYLPVEINFLFGTTQWTYVGQFVPHPNNPGFYDIQSMVVSSGPVPFIAEPLIPAAVVPGGPGFNLTVSGTGFVPSSVVNWNSSPRTTTFVSPSQLTATILASDIAEDGTGAITVSNPSGGGSTSNVAFVIVTNPYSPPSFNMNNYAVGSAPENLVAADFNGDGLLDIATSNLVDRTVSILLGNGDGTFQQKATYQVGANAFAIGLGDFNGDGKLDLVVADYGANTVSILLGNGDGTFQSQVLYPTGKLPIDVSVGDFNGDGKLDLAIAAAADSAVCVLLGNGDGTFQPYVEYSSGAAPSGITTGDFNGDGVLDLALTTSGGADQGPVSILLGNGDGSFQSPIFYTTGVGYLDRIKTADLNGDGKLDLIATGIGYGSESGGLSVLLGNGDGTFRTHVDYLLASAVDAVTVGDFNGDGKLDLAAPLADTSDQVAILLGNGDGTFGAPLSIATGYDPAGILAADLNGDGRLDIVTGNRDSTISVLLQSPIVSLSPAALQFGNQNVGTSGTPQNVTLTNTGSALLKISSIAVTGSNSGDFSQYNNCASSLISGATCTITVTFSPTVPGLRSASVSITDNAVGSAQTVSLTGTGTGATAVLSPTSVNFGNQTVGVGNNQGVLVNLTNTGNIALIITSIAITGANSGDFSQQNLCPSSLAAGGICTITVSFTPTTVGARTAALSIIDNAPNSPQTVSLTGVGVLPAVALSPTTLTFPTQVVFTNSKAQIATLSNTGLGILSITKIAITGSFTQTNNCGSLVNAGSSCTLTVTFKPTKVGSITGSLSITDNAPLSPQKVSLKGTGTYVQLTPVSLNFGNQPVGTKSIPKKITLSNKGSVAVNITKISLTGANATNFAQTNTCGTSVAAGASCSITVTFTPSAKGKRTGNVSITDNGGGSPQTVSLSGTGT